MGLDQYAWAFRQRPEKDVDFEMGSIIIDNPPDGEYFDENGLFKTKDPEKHKAVAYWRKHPNLHGKIQQIYDRKGGSEHHWGSFAGPVVLDLEDITDIETATKENTLPKTEGLFFGESRPEDDETTLEFCSAARKHIADGWTVVYDSSW